MSPCPTKTNCVHQLNIYNYTLVEVLSQAMIIYALTSSSPIPQSAINRLIFSLGASGVSFGSSS